VKEPTNDVHQLKVRQSVEKFLTARGNVGVARSKSSQKLREANANSPKNGEREKEKRKSSKILLSYEQTMKLMEEFIRSKQVHNEKAKKKRESYETAEEYLSTFFTSKYGVKTLAINWSLNFIRSL
jgi:hypothetical protein